MHFSPGDEIEYVSRNSWLSGARGRITRQDVACPAYYYFKVTQYPTAFEGTHEAKHYGYDKEWLCSGNFLRLVANSKPRTCFLRRV